MRVLIVGFNALNNTSCLLAKELNKNKGYEILLLNYGFKSMHSQLNKIDYNNYDYIFMFGDKTKNTKSYTFEQVALNIQGLDKEILTNHNTAYKTTIEIESICKELRKNNIICRLSNHAGTHFCNYGYYLLLNKTSNTNCKVLLTHITRYSKKLDVEVVYKNIEFIINSIINK